MTNYQAEQLVYRLTGMDIEGGGACVLTVEDLRSIIQATARFTRAECAELAAGLDAPHVAAAICIDGASGGPH